MRLDQLLVQRFPDISRSRWKALVEAGLFQVSGKTQKNSSKLKTDQTLDVDVAAAGDLLREKSIWEIRSYRGVKPEVIFENEKYLVVNKPSGVPVHPRAGIDPEETLVAWLLETERLGKVDPEARVAWGESVLEDERPGIVHRLDRGTSGALVIAKNPEVHRILAKQFEARTAGRIYLAVVSGNLKKFIDDPKSYFRKHLRDGSAHMALHWNRKDTLGRFVSSLSRDPTRRTNFRVDPSGSGRRASTDFFQLAQFENHSLIALKLGTGRTHQIRVHLSFFGLPIVGDSQYGGQPLDGDLQEAPRLLLHARSLYLKDPSNSQEKSFDASVPSYLTDFCLKRGLSSTELDSILNKSWAQWNSIFLKAGVAD
jgi:23S rRNA pseudouridine1911/1915/1917 synthase